MYRYEKTAAGYRLTDENGEAMRQRGGFGTAEVAPMPTVAVAYQRDPDGWLLHKHGSPAKVRAWAADTRARLAAGGHQDMAAAIEVLEGELDVQQLNAAVSTSGAVQTLVEDHALLQVDGWEVLAGTSKAPAPRG